MNEPLRPAAPAVAPAAAGALASASASASASPSAVATAAAFSAAPVLRRWRAWFAYAALRLGPAGLAGLALGVAALLLLVAERSALQHAAATQAAADPLRAAWQRGSAATPPVADAATLLAALPPAERVADFIEQLHGGAARAGVAVERAEYRTPVLAQGRVQRAQVVLPVAGAYPALRNWLAQLLEAHPSVAIDEMNLQRDAEPGRVRGRVVLSHYSRSAP